MDTIRHQTRHVVSVGLIFLSMVSATVPASAVDDEDAPELRRSWREMKTSHFVVLGDASEGRMRDVARSLEALRSFLGHVVGDHSADPIPTYVFVFHNERSFAPYELQQLDGKPRGIDGFFLGGVHGNYLAVNGGRREALIGIAQHEYVHAFTRYRSPPVPLWFSEGLAELYSTFEAKDDHVYIGKIIDRHLIWLQQNSMIPLIDFLSMSKWSPQFHDEGTRRGVFYAQSWLLVHYLALEAENGLPKLIRYLKLQRDRVPPAVAFEQAFGVEPAEMEQRLRRYIRSRSFSFRRADLQVDLVDKRLPARKLSEPEALARLGELLAMQGVGRFKDGNAHLRAAIARDATLVRGHVGLGLLQLRAGNWGNADEMADHFEEARRLAPEDRMIAFLYALARAKRGDSAAELRADLTQIVNGNPRFRAGWWLLAWSWADAIERLDEATRVFEGAHRMIPEDEIYAQHLHSLYLATERADDAARLVETFFAPRDLTPAIKLPPFKLP